ncbi:hypothetical protein KQ51_01703 [Candidatus Izimaplasma bacterium HR1]|jgi:uncharacterized protein YegL|uniref:vWA domain-containing protein n=1 Tax=Candidatus Izimoplasma sp. HR1 TaxID=1541959 RepID=UPI0004F66257|nr:hypothetical protein KQ51_01703 [Candidatus Izimaplasma bacterium HR1]
MKKNITEIVFILDRSGSMGGLEEDTIGGFNALIEKQRKEDGEAYLTTVLFDDRYDMINKHENIENVNPLTSKEYYPRGMTALLDAVGKTILKIKRQHERLDESEVPKNTLVVITTDGHENASKEFTYRDIRTLIKKQTDIYNWEFIFLGANIDAAKEGEKFGIRRERSVNYHADHKGVEKHYKELSKTVSNYRMNSKIDDNWDKDLNKDFTSRNQI